MAVCCSLPSGKVVVVIPCFNEEKYIAPLVYEALLYVDEVVVVDNLSTDYTAAAAHSAGARVCHCPTKGMGAATRMGIAHSSDAEIIVTLDGDGQHNPNDIPKLVRAVVDGADLALGVRSAVGMPLYRRVGNLAIVLATCIGSKKWLSDAQCGMRAFNQAVAGIRTTEIGFGCITELIIKARKAGCRIEPVEVSCLYHGGLHENSTINPVVQGVSVLLQTIRWRIWEHLGV